MRYKRLTTEQIYMLERYYSKDKYISCEDTLFLADKLSISSSKIYNWFNHKRTKEKSKKRPLEDNNNNNKVKRDCRLFSNEEKIILENYFVNVKMPTDEQILELAEQFDRTYSKIKKWFWTRIRDERRQCNRLTLPQLYEKISNKIYEPTEESNDNYENAHNILEQNYDFFNNIEDD